MTLSSLRRRLLRRKIVWMLARQLRAAAPPQLRLAIAAAEAARKVAG